MGVVKSMCNMKQLMLQFFGGLMFCASAGGLFAEERYDMILNMVHHNPGEPRWVTGFNDAAYLKSLGYTGEIPKLEPQCGLTYDDFDDSLLPVHTHERLWVGRQAAEFRKYVALAKKAGLPLYPQIDVLVVPQRLMTKYGAEMKDEKGRLTILKPRTREVLIAQLNEFFVRYRDVAGLTIRFGETYLHDTPHHCGGSPVRTTDEHAALLGLLREEVCVRRNKKLIYRTWDFGQLHTQPKLYLEATKEVAPHPNLYLSVKHVDADFMRGRPFNRTIGVGDLQQIVEVSIDQGGLYGKNAYPYYFARGVIDGFNDMDPKERRGIRSLNDDPKIRGFWFWTWGDGWKGPYFDNELWMKLNEGVLRGFALHPDKSEEELFCEYAQNELGISEADIAKFRAFCLKTEDAVFFGQHTKLCYLENQEWWCRDQHFLNLDLSGAYKAGCLPALLKEKRDNLVRWRELELEIAAIRFPDAENARFARVSTAYGRIKYELSEIIWRLYAREAEEKVDGEKKRLTDNEIRAFLAEYDAKWAEWERLYRSDPCCPTLYETDFGWSGMLGPKLKAYRARVSAGAESIGYVETPLERLVYFTKMCN